MSSLVRNIFHGSCFLAGSPSLPSLSYVAKQTLQQHSSKTGQVGKQIFSRFYSELDPQKPVQKPLSAEEQISSLKLYLNNHGIRIRYLEDHAHSELPKKFKKIESANENINLEVPQKLKQIEKTNEKIASLLMCTILFTFLWTVYNTTKSNRLHNELREEINKLKGIAE